jgi:hypothetical protein
MAVQSPDLGGEDLLAIANLRIFFSEYFQYPLPEVEATHF